MRTAERLVYGWPSRDADPTGVVSPGRFVKAFPLDFPMGIGDLYEERPRTAQKARQMPIEMFTHQMVIDIPGRTCTGTRLHSTLAVRPAPGIGIWHEIVDPNRREILAGCGVRTLPSVF